MRHVYIDWPEYNDLCERLVARVVQSGWKFDSLLCLARGGMRPGDIFSRVYNSMPLAVLTTSSYRAAAGTIQGDLDIATYITGMSDLKGKLLSRRSVRFGSDGFKSHRALKRPLSAHYRSAYGRHLGQGVLAHCSRLLCRQVRGQPLDSSAL